MASLLRLWAVTVFCAALVIDASRVHLDPTDNAYRGLVVAISPKIKPVLGRQIIPNLEVSVNWSIGTVICITERHPPTGPLRQISDLRLEEVIQVMLPDLELPVMRSQLPKKSDTCLFIYYLFLHSILLFYAAHNKFPR